MDNQDDKIKKDDTRKSDEYIMHSSSSTATFQHQLIQQYLFGTCLTSSQKMDICRLFSAVVAVVCFS